MDQSEFGSRGIMFEGRERSVRELTRCAVGALKAGERVEGQAGEMSVLEHLLHDDGMGMTEPLMPVQRK